MRKRFLTGLAPLLVITAFAVVPAAAQAAPHWYNKGVLVGSTPVTVATSGAITFTTPGATIKCKVSDGEEIWNPVGGAAGQDLLTSFTLAKCVNKTSSSACPKGTAEVLPNGLPWPSHLIPGTPIRDEIQKMRFIIRCIPGTPGDEFEGSLTPEVGNGKLIFGGPGGGVLLDSFSNPLTLSGTDNLIAPPGKITAKDP
jgi:hypothetical protein